MYYRKYLRYCRRYTYKPYYNVENNAKLYLMNFKMYLLHLSTYTRIYTNDLSFSVFVEIVEAEADEARSMRDAQIRCWPTSNAKSAYAHNSLTFPWESLFAACPAFATSRLTNCPPCYTERKIKFSQRLQTYYFKLMLLWERLEWTVNFLYRLVFR